jgi:RNA polymerase sigma-70 factor, ECF subfamily
VLTLHPTRGDTEKPATPALLERAQAGDAEAFCELCRTYEVRLLRQAITLAGNVHLAEDLAQETLVEAWKALGRYNGKCQFFTWLVAILLNRHRAALRRQRLASLFTFASANHHDTQTGPGQSDPAPAPDEAAQKREQAALLHKCIQALPRKQREVVHLRFYVDESLEGIAAALGCSMGTVKSRLFHALENLRRMQAIRDHRANFKTLSDPYAALS